MGARIRRPDETAQKKVSRLPEAQGLRYLRALRRVLQEEVLMPKKTAKATEDPGCPLCGANPPGKEIECPGCNKLKHECCEIAGSGVFCFECEGE